jgi:CBS domain-containing protein
MEHVRAREIMTSPVITVGPDTPFRDIVATMLENGISGVPVVDGYGRLLGIVTEADLIHKEEEPQPQPALLPWHGSSLRRERRVNRHRKATGTTAAELMTENVVTATEESTVHELAHLMLSGDINRIPIVRDGRPVGIVTRADILKVFARSDETLVSAVKEALERDLWIEPSRLTVTCQNGLVTIAGEVERRTDRDLLMKWVGAIDGVVGLDAGRLTYRVDDLALGRVFR